MIFSFVGNSVRNARSKFYCARWENNYLSRYFTYVITLEIPLPLG